MSHGQQPPPGAVHDYYEYDDDDDGITPGDDYYVDYALYDGGGDEAAHFAVDRLGAGELWQQCLWPVASGDVAALFGKYLGACLAMRCLTSIGALPRCLCAMASASLGCYLVVSQLDAHCLYCVATLAVGTIVLLLCCKTGFCFDAEKLPRYGALWAVAYIVLCQLTLDAALFTRARGPLMIVTMKAVGACHDAAAARGKRSEDAPRQAIGRVVECARDCAYYVGYTLDCATVLFGCWLSFDEYKRLLEKKTLRASLLAVATGLLCLAFSFACLLYSACVAEWLIPQHLVDDYRWLWCYREAHTYRFSHYFTCFFGQAGILIAGYDLSGRPSTVCRLVDLEVPRSLVQIVVNWNLPTHRFLKIYVFRPVKKYGTFYAITATYLVSSMLHGFNVQMSLILLSLGFFTYSEFGCRKRLAHMFDSCVESHACGNECGHTHQYSSCRARVLNLFLGVLALMQYSYLGMLVNASSQAETGYSWQHAYNMWSKMAFSGHLIAMFMLSLTKVV